METVSTVRGTVVAAVGGSGARECVEGSLSGSWGAVTSVVDQVPGRPRTPAHVAFGRLFGGALGLASAVGARQTGGGHLSWRGQGPKPNRALEAPAEICVGGGVSDTGSGGRGGWVDALASLDLGRAVLGNVGGNCPYSAPVSGRGQDLYKIPAVAC